VDVADATSVVRELCPVEVPVLVNIVDDTSVVRELCPVEVPVLVSVVDDVPVVELGPVEADEGVVVVVVVVVVIGELIDEPGPVVEILVVVLDEGLGIEELLDATLLEPTLLDATLLDATLKLETALDCARGSQTGTRSNT
jgi:hypothetical protein